MLAKLKLYVCLLLLSNMLANNVIGQQNSDEQFEENIAFMEEPIDRNELKKIIWYEEQSSESHAGLSSQENQLKIKKSLGFGMKRHRTTKKPFKKLNGRRKQIV